MSRAAKAALLVLLAWWTWRLLTHPFQQDVVGGIFMHRVDLMFHEAGHLLWSPFGEFMTVFGGTLNQCLVPIVCAIAFYRGSRDLFAVSVMGWWLGENLQDVGMYINDARDLQLQLLGGGTGAEIEGHDWEHLLTMMHAITLDHRIGHVVQTAGAVLMIAGLGAAIFLLARPQDRGQAGGTRTAGTRTTESARPLPPRAGTSTIAPRRAPEHRTAAPTGQQSPT
jgi:hypothetical protein